VGGLEGNDKRVGSGGKNKSKGSGLFFGPGIGADSQIIAIELLIEPICFICNCW